MVWIRWVRALTPTIQKFPADPDGRTSAALIAPAFGLTAAQIDPIAINILNLQSTHYGGELSGPKIGPAGCKSALRESELSLVVSPVSLRSRTTSTRSVTTGSCATEKTRFPAVGSGTTVRLKNRTAPPVRLAVSRTDTQQNRFLSITHTHVFSASKINELRLGFSRFIFANIPTDIVNLSDIGATRGNSDIFPGMYQVTITGLMSIGTGVNDDRGTVSNQFNIVDTFSMIHGKHSLRFGGEAIQYQLNRFNNFAVRGALTTGATLLAQPPRYRRLIARSIRMTVPLFRISCVEE